MIVNPEGPPPPLDMILSQSHPPPILRACFPKSHLHVALPFHLPSSKWPLSNIFSHQNCLRICLFLSICVSSPLHYPSILCDLCKLQVSRYVMYSVNTLHSEELGNYCPLTSSLVGPKNENYIRISFHVVRREDEKIMVNGWNVFRVVLLTRSNPNF